MFPAIGGMRWSTCVSKLGWITTIGVCAVGAVPACWAAPMLTEVNRFTASVADSSSGNPPDTMGAVGRNNRFVELLNTGYAQYDTSAGASIGSRLTLEQFWDTAFTNTFNNPPPAGTPPPRVKASPDVFDPRVLYDDNTQRWYAVSVANRRSSESLLYVGVTTSNDPSPSNWRGFTVKADFDGKHWADFPTLGHSTKGVFIGTSMIPLDGTMASGEVHLTGVPLGSLTAGVPSLSGMRKVENIGITNSIQPAVDVEGITQQSNIPYHGFFVDPTFGAIRRMEIPGNFFTGGNLGSPTSFGAFATPGLVDVPYASALNLTPIDESPTLSSNVVLSLTGYWGVVNELGASGTDALRVFNLHPVSSTLISQTVIADPSFHYLYPSIGVSPFGEVVVGFNYSFIPPAADGAFFAPSAAAVGGGFDSNGDFTFGIPDLLQPSSATFERVHDDGRNRWGDYSAVTVRPNGHDFFSIQEFAHAPNAWATSVSELNVEGVDVFELDLKRRPAKYLYALAQPLEGGLSFLTMAMSGQLGAPNLPEELLAIGEMVVETYSFRFDAMLDTGDRGGPRTFSNLDATITQKFTLSLIEDDTRLFDTELLTLEVDLPDMLLTLDDLLPSLGQLALIDTADGVIAKGYIDLSPVLRVDSDGDGSFEQSLRSLAPSRLLLRADAIPEPTSAMLVLIGLAAWGLLRRRRLERVLGAPPAPSRRH